MSIEKKYLIFYILLSVALIANIDLASYSMRGDMYPNIFPNEEITFSIWRDDYHSGQTDLTKLFHNLPFGLIFYSLFKIGIPSYLIQKIYFVFGFLFIQISGYIFFQKIYKIKIIKHNNSNLKEGSNLKFACFAVGLFFLLNPYVISFVPAGQIDYIYAYAALILTYTILEDTLNSNKKLNLLNYFLFIFLSYFIFLQNYYTSILYILLILAFIIFNFKKILKTRKIKVYTLFFFSIFIIHAWAIIGFLNIVSADISEVLKTFKNDKLINFKYNSSENIIYPLSLLSNATPKMWSENPALSDYFDNTNYFFLNIIFLILIFSAFVIYNKNSYVRKIFIILILASLFALGSGFSLFLIIFSELNFFSVFRNPSKFLLLVMLCQAFLFGIAIIEIKKKLNPRFNKIFQFIIVLFLFIKIGPFADGKIGSTLEGAKIPKEYYEIRKIVNNDKNSGIGVLPYTTGAISYDWGPIYKGISFLDRFFTNPIFEVKYNYAINYNSLNILEKNKKDIDTYLRILRKYGINYLLVRKDVNEFKNESYNFYNLKDNNNLVIIFESKILDLYKLKNIINPKFYCANKITNDFDEFLATSNLNLNFFKDKRLDNKYDCPKKISFKKNKFLQSYLIEVEGASDFILSSVISFDQNWILSTKKKEQKDNLLMNNYSIAWQINKSDFKNNIVELHLNYKFQIPLFYLHIFSSAIFFILSIFLVLMYFKKFFIIIK